MIKTTPHKITILMGLLLSPSVFATDVDVDFTATVKATTCNITLTSLNGSNVVDNGNDSYTLIIPNMGLDKIVNKASQSEANFKLVASGCSSGISWIDTTMTGNQSGSTSLIIPQSSDSSSTTSNIGMGFKRLETSGDTFLKPNSAEYIRWKTTEISTSGLEMLSHCAKQPQDRAYPGNFAHRQRSISAINNKDDNDDIKKIMLWIIG